MKYIYCLAFCLLIICSCQINTSQKATFNLQIPSTFDSLPPIPANNLLSKSRIALGKKLFFDSRLSADGKVSCGSCHKKTFAYADNQKTTRGVHGNENSRNVPTLINVAYQNHLFMEGGIPSLEMQVMSPFVNGNEMGFTVNDAVKILKNDTVYSRMSKQAYGADLDAYTVAKAISCFERSLMSTGSAYDRYKSGEKNALSSNAIRGMKLFFSSRTKCSSCHSTFLFTDQEYHNIGLYRKYRDEGRAKVTLDTNDLGKFKTPTLRNIALTAPYMHDGSISTLENVIEHYNRGGEPNRNKDNRIDSLHLRDSEISDLKSFLNSLTDQKMPG